MDYKEIKKLMDDMGDSKLDSLEIEFPDGIKISMTKSSNKKVVLDDSSKTEIEKTIPIKLSKVQNEATVIEEENCKIIKSPMVGTFYNSSAPGKEPFVKVGDKISKGQVLCIVEAMKLMNEIESEFDGEVIEICANNEDVVEYGMPLFKIK